MRLALAIVFGLIFVTPADADVGIGVSAKTDSATVYVPVTVRRFMLEPYVRATDRESESSSTTGTAFSVPPTSASEVEAYSVGIGVFRVVPLAERMTLYYGGLLARIDEKVKSFTATGPTNPPALSQPSQSSTVEGQAVTPTLGFHYNIVGQLSIGGEIGWEHAKVDGVTTINSQFGSTQTSRTEITGNDTRANIILRFFF